MNVAYAMSVARSRSEPNVFLFDLPPRYTGLHHQRLYVDPATLVRAQARHDSVPSLIRWPMGSCIGFLSVCRLEVAIVAPRSTGLLRGQVICNPVVTVMKRTGTACHI